MNKKWRNTCLDGDWDLFFEENCLCKGNAFRLNSISALKESGHRHIKGTVPGNFELDMQQAGMLDDLFFGTSSLAAQKYENLHLWYTVTFNADIEKSGKQYFCFEGIDTFSEIYLNGKLIGKTDNMLIEHEIPADGLLNGENELVIHIIPVFIKARENVFETGVSSYLPYNSASLMVRKAAHGFGWDIMPRIMSGGIWKSVYLFTKPEKCIESVYFSSVYVSKELSTCFCYFRVNTDDDFLDEYTLEFDGRCEESTFKHTQRLWHTEGRTYINIKEPKLWWPKGMGEPNLYNISVKLIKNGVILDEYCFNAGVRIVKLDIRDVTDDDAGEFCFYVNNEKMFVRGTNWVPMDAFHSKDKERLPKALELLNDINCNMVRCWGGNVYENDIFFDFCDKNGIAVWQDFGMACATYPQNDEFANMITSEAESVICRLRNHSSLFLWAGDNECDISISWQPGENTNPNNNRITRKVLPNVLSRYDPFRPYLPSSPFCSEKAYRKNENWRLPEQHLWASKLYYKSDFFTNKDVHFVSETGYHGCPSPASLKKFLHEEKLWPWYDNDEWRIHATNIELDTNAAYVRRIDHMPKGIKHLFGIEPDNIEDFALASQITQAEADKFFVERFRLGKWDKTTGILIWNLIDGWPQFSDAVVDYYYTKKLAYHVLKRCQEPVALIFREPENGTIQLACANDTLESATLCYKVTNITTGKIVLESEATAPKNCTCDFDKIPVDTDETAFYLIEWDYKGKKYKNHYLCGTAPVSYECCLDGYKKSGLLNLEGF